MADLRKDKIMAWLHDDPKRFDVIHAEVKNFLKEAGKFHLPLDKTERYSIPLYAAPAPQTQRALASITSAQLQKVLNAASRQYLSDDLRCAMENHIRATWVAEIDPICGAATPQSPPSQYHPTAPKPNAPQSLPDCDPYLQTR